MSMNELQQQTNANIQAKANLIWEIATHLVGLFKPHEYGKVILPMTVLKRFDDALKPTKAAVVEMAKKLKCSTDYILGATDELAPALPEGQLMICGWMPSGTTPRASGTS